MADSSTSLQFASNVLTAGRDIHINTSNVFTAGHDIHINTMNEHDDHDDLDPLIRLSINSALGALYNSAERPDPPRCLPGTRKAILSRIDQWARDRSTTAKAILFLTGPTGAGKTAIAQTAIERWRKEKLVVPNFFFWQTSPKRNNKTYLIATIAFQLSKIIPSAQPEIEDAVGDGSVFEQSLTSQVNRLIVQPLRSTQLDGSPIIIVLDALDQCCMGIPKAISVFGRYYEQEQHEVLKAMAFACQNLPFLRVLITSCPERQLCGYFNEAPLDTISISISLNDDATTAADIRHYLDYMFSTIRCRFPDIHVSWPPEDQIAVIVGKASGNFIYPSSIIQHIIRRQQHPVKELNEVLTVISTNQIDTSSGALDDLYSLVLRLVSADSWPVVKIVLGFLCHLRARTNVPDIFTNTPAGHYSSYFERFMFLSEGELLNHLIDLHSILVVPQVEDSQPRPIHCLHHMLLAYLQNPSRSGDFSISKEDTFLQCSLLLIEHVNVEVSKHASNPKADQNRGRTKHILACLATFIKQCPPSVALMSGIWSLILDPQIEPRSGMELYSSVPMLTILGPSFQQLDRMKQLDILNYFLRCNIPEVRPSTSYRNALDRQLKEAIFQINPADPAAIEFLHQLKGIHRRALGAFREPIMFEEDLEEK